MFANITYNYSESDANVGTDGNGRSEAAVISHNISPKREFPSDSRPQ